VRFRTFLHTQTTKVNHIEVGAIAYALSTLLIEILLIRAVYYTNIRYNSEENSLLSAVFNAFCLVIINLPVIVSLIAN
jgi:hypothetical protein